MSLWGHWWWMILGFLAIVAKPVRTHRDRQWNITVLMHDEESEKCDANAGEETGSEFIYRTATDKAMADARLPTEVNVNVEFVTLGDDCIQSEGLLTIVRLINSPTVHAIIGAVASPLCRAVATFTGMRSKMFVTWGCLGLPHINPFSTPSYLPSMDQYGVEDEVTYLNDSANVISAEGPPVTSSANKSRVVRRYFYRISPPAVASARALVQIIKHFRWKQSAIIVTEDDGWLSLANRIDVALREEDFIVRHFIVLHRHGDQHHVRDKLASILPQVKAIILCVPVNSLEMHYVMQKAAELRMLSGQRCAFMAVHVRHPFIPPLSLTTARNFSLTPTPLVFTYVPPNATYNGALENSKFQNAINVTKDEDYQLFYQVYDCVALMMSVLMSRMLWREQEHMTVEKQMALDSITAPGFLGPILSTPAEGVKVHYTLLHYEPRYLSHRPLLYVRNGNVSLVENDTSALSLFPPADSACDFGDKDACNVADTTDRNLEPLGLVHLVVIIISSAFLCLGLICAVFLIRRILLRREMTKGPYGILIYPGDLVLVATRPPHTSNKHVNDFHSMEKPDLLKGSHDSLRGFAFNSNSTVIEDGITRARYNGDLVLVKYFQTRGFELRNKAIKELRIMHDLRHENVNTFLGYFVNPERPALVFEYCTRGSLQDVLSSENIKLDWSFKLSLLTDLVRGVKYLHSSPVRVHGRLTSRNCVIDSRWVLKITDYGLPNFYTAQGLPFPKSSATALLWAAPELLRNETALKRGTQAGDVYSFSIIMQEVLVRGLPYCMLPLTPSEIIEKVKHPPPMIRPSVSKQAAPPEAINIMRECWAEVPDMRPDFAIIYEQFKRLNHGKKVNIVDTMFQMLEKYSNNLEEIIRERTEQLAEEKKKTEQLLHRMLPSSVAERLKIGMPVEPEAYEEVTIYFSDIVGFTTISAYSTPMEVVDLLNDLYTCFDATIDGYNVYKVETIGDAYMVVGGLPVRIEDHACQVANMAMDLLHQSGKFKIAHLPNTPLKLRIGIHTGPCCAGVVGLTMPRYCLFGDTVNTASRLESTGHAWRIHISQTTKDKLDRSGGYHITCRGVIELKGKGKATTYWLHGKDGFDKPLPLPTEGTSHGLDEELIRQCLASSQRTADAARCAASNQGMALDEQAESVGDEPRSSVGSDEIVLQGTFVRTHSDASDMVLRSPPQTGSADTQSLHAHPRGQPRKALEFIPNANSYIINMNRAHSLDSDEPSAATANNGKPDPRPADRALARHLLSRTSAGSGIDNHCQAHSRRSSEAWDRDRCKDWNQNARRFSNPRYYALAPADERNGNFLATVPGSAGSEPDVGAVLEGQGAPAVILPYQGYDRRALDSSF